MERNNKSTTHWIFYVIAVLLVLIAVLLVLLLLKQETPGPAADPSTKPSTAGTGQPAEDPAGDETEAVGIPLDGRWTTLYLPRDLEHSVTTERTETETGVHFSFRTRIGEKEVELFTVLLTTQPTQDYQLGILKDTRDGDIYVYTSVNEQPAQAWSPEEYAGIDALQQRINDLISQFYEDARFQAVH